MGGGESGNPESFPQILGVLWNVGGFLASGGLRVSLSFSCPKRKRKGPAVPMRRPPAGAGEQGMDLNGVASRLVAKRKNVAGLGITLPQASPVVGEVPRSGGGVVKPAAFPVYGSQPKAYNPSVAYRRQLPLHRGADLYLRSLPCGWGGAAQRRWGCEACGVSCLRVTAESLQPLSRLPAPAPLTQGSRSLPQEPPLWLGRCRAAAVGL